MLTKEELDAIEKRTYRQHDKANGVTVYFVTDDDFNRLLSAARALREAREEVARLRDLVFEHHDCEYNGREPGETCPICLKHDTELAQGEGATTGTEE